MYNIVSLLISATVVNVQRDLDDAGDTSMCQWLVQSDVHALFAQSQSPMRRQIRHEQKEFRHWTDSLTCSPKHGGESPPNSEILDWY
ncbi:jg14695 [Pararge aegeria aegeria]|uniref:Jg14695 protein n=1 Tax=Pararge aegeria aegeria TaxID=348720 RepID=A0A8S4SJ62_9NEOP|nr:jg14695 [Pararge aegeria aegeria]